MIPNQWYVVLDASELKDKPLGVKRFGERLVFWRDRSGTVTCQVDQCCHRGAQLSLGQVLGDCIECPFHGWQFDREGACTLVPSNGKSARIPKKFRVKTYTVKEAYGWIWLFWGDVEEGASLPPIHYFDLIKGEGWRTATMQDEWPVHYTRAIENQLDVTHLAFTHKKTIGDPTRPIVDGPLYRWIDDHTLRFCPLPQPDEGQVARRAREVQPEEFEGKGYLEFHFPNTWMLHISPKMINAAAFVPVDEETSITYIRLYQKFVKWPLLGPAMTRLMNWFSRRVLAEDRPMVLSQMPIRSDFGMDELLVPGDAPIVEYRRRRQELLEAAASGEPARSMKGKTNGPDDAHFHADEAKATPQEASVS